MPIVNAPYYSHRSVRGLGQIDWNSIVSDITGGIATVVKLTQGPYGAGQYVYYPNNPVGQQYLPIGTGATIAQPGSLNISATQLLLYGAIAFFFLRRFL